MQRLRENIKNREYHNVYLFYGEEDYLKKMYRDSLKKSVLADSDDMNFSYFEGKDTDILQVQEIADTLPFFSDNRLIVIENSNMFKTSNTFADYLPSMPDSTIILFIEKEIDKRNKLYKYVNKNALAVEMNRMSESDTKKWIAVMLKNSGKVIKESTAQYLLSRIDNSMSNIKNELDKLISYCDNRDEITVSDIDSICSVQITGHMFQMIDAVASGRRNETLRLYNELLELRESPMSILYMLTRHFNILLQIHSLGSVSKNEIAGKIGIPPFTVNKYQNQAKRFTTSQLKDHINMCIETEYQFKRGQIGDQIGVELLLVQFAG